MIETECLTSAVKIERFNTLNSTNECAKQWLKDGIDPPFWIVTDSQTNGRGRQGRDWISLKGNLFASTALAIKAQGVELSSLSLVAGLAIYDALVKCCASPLNITLKWPNDILFGEAKLGGILIENSSEPLSDVSHVVIGFGLNIQSNPVVEGRETCCLLGLNHDVTRDELLAALIDSLESWIKRWDNGNNLDDIIEVWLRCAAPIGAPLTVKIGQSRFTGTFAGLDHTGALKLELPDKTIKQITGGEVL